MGDMKPGWRRHEFGEMVSSASRKARGWRPQETGVDRYVGLEHLDSNTLKIRRWGSPENVGTNSDLRIFEPGDVILARRGIEQRKVGVAEFRGVASGHALVFRAKPGVVLPEFLPFFIQSEAFMGRADQFSVGSLSHTVNLSTLMRQQFVLPPLADQRRFAQGLEAAFATVEAWRDVAPLARAGRRSALLNYFRPDRGPRDVFPTRWQRGRIDAYGEVRLGQQRHPTFETGTNVRPYLRVANVMDGWIDQSDVLAMHFPEDAVHKLELRDGDILLNEGQSTELVGRSAIYRGEVPGACFQNSLIRYRCGPGVMPEFAHAYFQHMLYTAQFSRVAQQTTSMAHLSAVRFAALQLPVPPMSEQRELMETLGQWDLAIQGAIGRLQASVSLYQTLANELLGSA